MFTSSENAIGIYTSDEPVIVIRKDKIQSECGRFDKISVDETQQTILYSSIISKPAGFDLIEKP